MTITRKCDRCGDAYFRRNLIEAWTIRSAGHRRGWHKEVAKVCVKCMSVSESRRIFSIVGVSIEPVMVSKKGRELANA